MFNDACIDMLSWLDHAGGLIYIYNIRANKYEDRHTDDLLCVLKLALMPHATDSFLEYWTMKKELVRSLLEAFSSRLPSSIIFHSDICLLSVGNGNLGTCWPELEAPLYSSILAKSAGVHGRLKA